MIGRNCGCTLEGLAIGLLSGWSSEYNMAPRGTTYMEPPIIGSSHRQAQVIVVGIGATDQHSPTTRQQILDQSRMIEPCWCCFSHKEPLFTRSTANLIQRAGNEK